MSSLTGVNKSLVIFAALVIVLAGIKAASVIVIPFVLAAFIAIICNPLIRFFARYGIPKAIAVIFVMMIIVGVGIKSCRVGWAIDDRFLEESPRI